MAHQQPFRLLIVVLCVNFRVDECMTFEFEERSCNFQSDARFHLIKPGCITFVLNLMSLFFVLKFQVLLSEARVLALGPRFMTVYIEKLAVRSS